MKKRAEKNIKTAFILNLIFSLIELVGGMLTSSVAIISDSLHDFGDAISIAISMVLEKKSKKKPDERYTYGYLRYSILGALITSMILLVGSVIVLYNAIPKLLNPGEVNYDGMMILAIIGIIINGAATLKTSKSNNLNEKAINLHLLEDVLGWVAVLVGSIIIKIFKWYVVDSILSLGITIYILTHVIINVKQIMEIFMEKSPKRYSDDCIMGILKENKQIQNVHHIHIWTLDGVNNYATLHIVVNHNINCKEIAKLKEDIRRRFIRIGINHVTIEVESEEEVCEEMECHIECEGDNKTHKHS